MFNTKIFSERLKAARTEKHISQADLAKAVGVSAATISSYETANGTKIPSLDRAAAIADELGISLDWLRGKDSTNKVKISDYDTDTFWRALVVVLSNMATELKNCNDSTAIHINNSAIIKFAAQVQDVLRVYHNGTLATDLFEACIDKIITNFEDYEIFGGQLMSKFEAVEAYNSLIKKIRQYGIDSIKQGIVFVSPFADPTFEEELEVFVSEKTLQECKKHIENIESGD